MDTMKIYDDPKEENTLRLCNDFIESSSRMTFNENQIFLAILKVIPTIADAYHRIGNKKELKFRISTSEIYNVFKNANASYDRRNILNAIVNLYKKTIFTRRDYEVVNGEDLKLADYLYNETTRKYEKVARGTGNAILVIKTASLFKEITYSPTFRSLQFTISEVWNDKNKIYNLENFFTLIRLDYYFKLRSRYSQILYTYFKSKIFDRNSHKLKTTRKVITLSTSEVKDIVGLTADDYVSLKHGKLTFDRNRFDLRVLKKPCQEISQDTDINVYVERHGQGSSAEYVFYISTKGFRTQSDLKTLKLNDDIFEEEDDEEI